MYQVGDRVVYGSHGICVVKELESRVLDGKNAVYLVLEPTGQPGSRYLVPTHNAAAMKKVRPMLDRAALETILSSAAVRTDIWIRDEGQRKQAYRELISSGDYQRLMQMVWSLYHYQAERSALGKKMHMCDENFLRDAERILAGEIAAAQEIMPVEAVKYLRERLKEDA